MNNISKGLSCAVAGLLGTSSVALPEDATGSWNLKSSFLIYNESGRVSATEASVSANKEIDTNETLALKLTIDSLTGASASGAVSANQAQTFTRPSGEGSYTTSANQTPLDNTFRDTRVDLSVDWVKPIKNDLKLKLGSNISTEYDYQSFSINTGIERSFNSNNSTLSVGTSFAKDSIKPVGGVPIVFSNMEETGVNTNRESSGTKTKNTLDLLVSLTQIIDKNSLFQLNYSSSRSSGYHTDPYKVISVVDAVTGEITLNGNISNVVYENRPENRSMDSIFFKYKRNLTGSNVLDTSYRYLWDDWGITSHTVDTHYKFRLSENSFLEPHIRYYSQSSADLYTPYFTNNNVPTSATVYASSDYRLGSLDTFTIGLTYGKDNIDSPWSTGLEYYKQIPANVATFGALNNQNLNPDVSAVILKLNYDF